MIALAPPLICCLALRARRKGRPAINWRRVAVVAVIAFAVFNQGACERPARCNPLTPTTCEP